MSSLLFAFALVFTCLVSGRVVALCTESDMKECGFGMGENVDPEAMCGVLKCVKATGCELPPQLSAIDGDCSNGACSLTGVMKCTNGIPLNNLTMATMTNLCPFLGCFSSLLPSCEGEMKKTVEGLVTGLSASCQPTCEISKVEACFAEGFPDMKTISDQTCKDVGEMIECLNPVMSHCEKTMKENYDMLADFSKCCPNLLAVQNKCFPSGEPYEEEEFNFNHCGEMEKAYSCVMGESIGCGDALTPIIKSAKANFTVLMEQCENQGYNLTISLETGKQLGEKGKGKGPGDNASSIQPTVATLFGLMMVVVTFWF